MKNPNSIRNLTIAAIKRSAIDIEAWKHSKIVQPPYEDVINKFDLNADELPVFEVSGPNKYTLITTQRIIEISGQTHREIRFDNVANVNYHLAKVKPNDLPDFSMFNIVDLNGNQLNFQIETGKAAVGVIKSVDTIRQLSKS